MSVRRALLGLLLCALACSAACRNDARPAAPPRLFSEGPPGEDIFSLQLTQTKLRADGASDALLGQLGASACRYFRAIAEPFKHRTCEAFRDLRWRLPSGA